MHTEHPHEHAQHGASLVAGEAQEWQAVCRVEDIPLRGARVVERHEAPHIALFRSHSERIYALADRCPHKGGPLSQGLVHGERVACPLHNWNIELASGSAVAPDQGCTHRFDVQVREGWVYLQAHWLRAPEPGAT